MIIIPFTRYSFECNLLDGDVIKLLKKNTIKFSPSFNLRDTRRLFQGKIHDNKFYIVSTSKFMNSFQPYVHGKIIPFTNFTRVKMFMTIHPSIMIFLIIWFYLSRNEIEFILFGILLCSILFWLGVRKTKNELKEVFGSYIISKN